MTNKSSKNSQRSAKRKPARANGQSKAKSSGGGGYKLQAPKQGPLLRPSAPASMGVGPSTMRTHVTLGKKFKGDGGIEVTPATFRQYLTGASSNSTNSALFCKPGMPNANMPLGIAVNPMLLGGRLQMIAEAYRQYRFKKLVVEYVPGCPSTQNFSLALGYNPRGVNNTIVPSSVALEGGVPTAGPGATLFTKLLSLASVAAGPLWGPVIVEAAGLAGPLVNGMTKWWRNAKPSVSTGMLESLVANFAAARLEHNKLLGIYQALQDSITILTPDYPGLDDIPLAYPGNANAVNTFGTTSENIVQLAAMMGQVRSAAQSDLDLTCQGMIGASASSLAPGSGFQNQVGMFMISGEIEFCDPYGDGVGYDTVNDSAPLNPEWIGYTESALKDFGDPLDALYPSETARHPGRDAAEKNSYLWRNWDDSDLLFDMLSGKKANSHITLIHQMTGHDLTGQALFARTTLEEHAHQIQLHDKLTRECLSFKKSAQFLRPEQTATASCVDPDDKGTTVEKAGVTTVVPTTSARYGDWVQVEEQHPLNQEDVKRIATVLQKMAALTAASN
jgi:hypothetical protein